MIGHLEEPENTQKVTQFGMSVLMVSIRIFFLSYLRKFQAGTQTVSSSPVQVLLNVDKLRPVHKISAEQGFERTFSLFFCSNKID